MKPGAGRLVRLVGLVQRQPHSRCGAVGLFRPGIRVDFVAGSPVLIDQGRFDRHKAGEHLCRATASLTRLVPRGNLQPYLLAGPASNRARAGTSARRAIRASPGVRLCSGGWQSRWAPWASDRISGNQVVAYSLGWAVRPRGGSPRLTLDAHHAFGRRRMRRMARGGTFDQMYAGQPRFPGDNGPVWLEEHAYGQARPRSCTLQEVQGLHRFSRNVRGTTQDGLYAAQRHARSVLNRKATSSHVGSEADVTVLLSIQPWCGAPELAWDASFAGRLPGTVIQGQRLYFPLLQLVGQVLT